MNATTKAAPPSERLVSLDAYRGFVMFLMMGELLNFTSVSEGLPGNAFWRFLREQQTHSEWVGCSLHDLIQPSFSFIVGVALPFSIASRRVRGQSQGLLTLHAFWRALLLMLLGVFLNSLDSTRTEWALGDTLSQIGLGYGFLFMLGYRSVRTQWLVVAGLLAGYWALYAFWPLPGANFDWHAAGVTPDWSGNLSGFAAHWNKNTNPGRAFDTWFLNLFPREHPFTNNSGGYCTLNFIPTLAVMTLGLIAGGWLRSERRPWDKVRWLVIAGCLGISAGWLMNAVGMCPLVKRIWTPSWALFSAGWCMWLLAAFYALIEIRRLKAWAFPLIVIGVNSIAAYCMTHLFVKFISRNLVTHLGEPFFIRFGAAYEHLIRGGMVLLILWLILLWMQRRKIFLRI